MKVGIIYCSLFLAVFAQSQSINQHQLDSMTVAHEKQVIGKPLPVFIASGDNGIVNNESLIGKVTFINMWLG